MRVQESANRKAEKHDCYAVSITRTGQENRK